MKIVITGSPSVLIDKPFLNTVIHVHSQNSLKPWASEITEIVTAGEMVGVDAVAEAWADDYRTKAGILAPIPVRQIIANANGDFADGLKNQALALASYGDLLLVIHDSKSRFITDLKSAFSAADKTVFEIIFTTSPAFN
jgi:hypothetical protein